MALIDFTRPYRAKEARVATWDAVNEVWLSSVNIPNLQGVTITPVFDNDEMKIFGTQEHFLSSFAGAEVSLDFGGMDDPSYNAMTGVDSVESGSGAAEIRRTIYAGGKNLAYFGLIVSVDTDGLSDAHWLLPRVKLDNLMEMAMVADSEFTKPNITAKAGRLRLADNSLYPVLEIPEYAVDTTIETDFNVAFQPLA